MHSIQRFGDFYCFRIHTSIQHWSCFHLWVANFLHMLVDFFESAFFCQITFFRFGIDDVAKISCYCLYFQTWLFWPNLAQFDPNLAQIWHNLVHLTHFVTGLGSSNWCMHWQWWLLSKTYYDPKSRVSTFKIGCFGPIWPKSGPNLAQFGPFKSL